MNYHNKVKSAVVLVWLLVFALIFGSLYRIGMRNSLQAKRTSPTRPVEAVATVAAPAAPAVHTQPPEGCEILCTDNGYYTVLIEGKFTFTSHPLYTNRQDAIDRAWESYKPDNKPEPDLNSFHWKACQP